jgi:eukaryotic-like serine/threonine-protein kinase
MAPDDANFSETYGRQQLAFGPDEAGAHPRSLSPVGAVDMAGNVWEMTRSLEDPQQIVLRGGGWYFEQLTSRAMNREVGQTTALRDMLVGFRVCANIAIH